MSYRLGQTHDVRNGCVVRVAAGGKTEIAMVERTEAPEQAGAGEDIERDGKSSVRRLVVVSNRVPSPGQAGGLAVALSEALAARESVWIGWSGEISDNLSLCWREDGALAGEHDVRIGVFDLLPAEYDGYYAGYANRALWPALHYRLDLSDFRDRDYATYRRVGRRFADHLATVIRPDDAVWLHDYHLMGLPEDLREAGVMNPVGFFSHIPFPPPEIFQAIPQHMALLKALMHCDLIGFQSNQDRANFERAVIDLGGGNWRPDGRVFAFGRLARAQAFPIGINAGAFADINYEGTERTGPALILGVDRMDYSKGIPQRIQAVGELFNAHPELKGAATLLQIAPPSRSDVDAYARLRQEIDEQVGHVNGTHGAVDWAPIQYVASNLEREELAPLYRRAQVGLVTPLRDGMNLVAKEFVIAQDSEDPGVLVLSCFAGAAEQLDAALIVNPHDISGVARAIHQALNMPLGERVERHAALLASVQQYDARWWADAFLDALVETHGASGAQFLWPHYAAERGRV